MNGMKLMEDTVMFLTGCDRMVANNVANTILEMERKFEQEEESDKKWLHQQSK